MNVLYKAIRKVKIWCTRAYIKLFCPRIRIGSNFNFRRHLDLNCSSEGIIELGNNVFFNNDCSLNSHKGIYIGNDCIFGENVKIYDHNHRFYEKGKLIRQQEFSCRDVKIGNDCWIASNVIILPGAEIGDHVVIGAGCTISGIIAPNTVVKMKQELISEEIRLR